MALRPKVPTVVNANGQPSSKVRQSFTRLTITEAHLTRADGSIDAKALARILGHIQDNTDGATLGARSNPLGSPYVVEGLSMSTAGGSIGAVTATGTSPPSVTLAGAPLGKYSFQIDITTGGALGTAAFRWSSNGGTTWSATGVLTSATVNLGSTGITANFPSATYTNDNVYVAATTMPTVVVKHGLGESVARWHPTRTYAGSQPFAAVEVTYGSADWPSTYPRDQYVLFYPGCTGTYDLTVYGS